MGENLSRSSYYKIFIYGNSGKDYLNSHYPPILTIIIKNFREDILFIATRDTNGVESDDIDIIWSNITENTLRDNRRFQNPPLFEKNANEKFLVKLGANNHMQINIKLIPKNLEFQIANINTIRDNLSIPNEIKNNCHDYLKHVANLKNINEEQLIKNSVSLLLEEKWLEDIISLIQHFE